MWEQDRLDGVALERRFRMTGRVRQISILKQSSRGSSRENSLWPQISPLSFHFNYKGKNIYLNCRNLVVSTSTMWSKAGSITSNENSNSVTSWCDIKVCKMSVCKVFLANKSTFCFLSFLLSFLFFFFFVALGFEHKVLCIWHMQSTTEE